VRLFLKLGFAEKIAFLNSKISGAHLTNADVLDFITAFILGKKLHSFLIAILSSSSYV